MTFRINTASTYNIFSAAATLGLERVVWASSETVLGLPFDRERPAYAPIDEEHPTYPEFSYALSKLLSEEMARQFNRWTGIPYVGLRFSNIMEPHDYARFPGFWDDPLERKWNLWGYVDARDVAQSCWLALASTIGGADVPRRRGGHGDEPPEHGPHGGGFPDVEIRRELGEFETLLRSQRRATRWVTSRVSWWTDYPRTQPMETVGPRAGEPPVIFSRRAEQAGEL